MRNKFMAVVKQDGDWWIGWIEEIPGVNCQERSHEALTVSLKDALQEALEFNREDATVLPAAATPRSRLPYEAQAAASAPAL